MKDMVHVLAFVMETSCEKVILWTNVTLQHAKGTSAPSNPRQALQVILETLPIKTHPKEACSAHTKVTSQSNLIIAPIFFDPDPHQAQAPRSILITSDKNFWVKWRYMCIKQMTKLTLQSWRPIEEKKVILEMCLQQMPPEDKWLPVALATTALSFSFAVLPETKCLKSNIYIYICLCKSKVILMKHEWGNQHWMLAGKDLLDLLGCSWRSSWRGSFMGPKMQQVILVKQCGQRCKK